MAIEAVLLSLTFILNFSDSITSAEVVIFPLHDVSVCGGMKAVFMCNTTTESGYLRWSINSVAVEAFDSSKPVPSNITTNRGVFLFTNRSNVSGNYIYSSTASINVSAQTTVVTCSDGLSDSSHTVSLQVNYMVNEITVSVSGNNITASWSKPNGSGVCCEQYHVVTPEEDVDAINTTSYTLQNITTQEQYAFISVRCLDKLGTKGRPFVYRPNITRPLVVVFPPVIVGDFCGSSNVTYEIKLVFQESASGALVAEIQDCFIDGHNCSLESRMATIRTVGLDPFNDSIRFSYYLGHDSNEYTITMNASQLITYQEACNYKAKTLTLLYAEIGLGIMGVIICLLIVLLAISVIFHIIASRQKMNNLKKNVMELENRKHK